MQAFKEQLCSGRTGKGDPLIVIQVLDSLQKYRIRRNGLGLDRRQQQYLCAENLQSFRKGGGTVFRPGNNYTAAVQGTMFRPGKLV